MYSKQGTEVGTHTTTKNQSQTKNSLVTPSFWRSFGHCEISVIDSYQFFIKHKHILSDKLVGIGYKRREHLRTWTKSLTRGGGSPPTKNRPSVTRCVSGDPPSISLNLTSHIRLHLLKIVRKTWRRSTNSWRRVCKFKTMKKRPDIGLKMVRLDFTLKSKLKFSPVTSQNFRVTIEEYRIEIMGLSSKIIYI